MNGRCRNLALWLTVAGTYMVATSMACAGMAAERPRVVIPANAAPLYQFSLSGSAPLLRTSGYGSS